MDPTTRMLRLLGLLQAHRAWRSIELAERLGVTTRTVRRDVTRLRDLGYAVDSLLGPDGGYQLAHSQVLPPLVLTDDEAVAVAVGLRTAAVSGIGGLDEAAIGAIAKLETTLPASLRTKVTALGEDTIHLVSRGEAVVDPDVLAVVALACRREERLRIAYTDRAGVGTRRDIDPYRVVRTEAHWYLVARDVRKDAWRTLRVDRISEPQPLGVKVRIDDPPDAATLVSEGLSVGGHQREALVRLAVPMGIARRFIAPTHGVLSPDGPEATLLRIGADHPWWTARYLVGLACPFEILEPVELVQELHRLGRLLGEVGIGAGQGLGD